MFRPSRAPLLWVLLTLLVLSFFAGRSLRVESPEDSSAPPPTTNVSGESATAEGGSESSPPSLADPSFSQENATVVREGLKYRDVKVGSGSEPRAPQVVTIEYALFLSDGTQVDSTRQRGTPFSYTFGSGQTVEGFDEALAGMRPGGRRTIWIAPPLGYRNGAPGIPRGATLIFDVTLLRVADDGEEAG